MNLFLCTLQASNVLAPYTDQWIVFTPESAKNKKERQREREKSPSMCLYNVFLLKLVMALTQIPLRKEAFTEEKKLLWPTSLKAFKLKLRNSYFFL